jgi:hypothetical protein
MMLEVLGLGWRRRQAGLAMYSCWSSVSPRLAVLYLLALINVAIRGYTYTFAPLIGTDRPLCAGDPHDPPGDNRDTRHATLNDRGWRRRRLPRHDRSVASDQARLAMLGRPRRNCVAVDGRTPMRRAHRAVADGHLRRRPAIRAKQVRCGEPDDARAELEAGVPLRVGGFDGPVGGRQLPGCHLVGEAA